MTSNESMRTLPFSPRECSACPVQYQANVCRLRAAVPDEYPALDRFIDLAPENDVSLIAGEEIFPGFVTRRLVQLNVEHMSVIQHNQPPAISLFE